MCDLFSWIESDGKVVFATDDVIEAAYHDRPVPRDDAVGHTFLVDNLNAYGKHCEGIWKVPLEIAKAVNSGLCRKMMKSQGWVGLKYTKDGKAKFDKVTSAGYIVLRQGATLTAPVLAQSGNIYLCQGATLTAPVLAQSGDIDLWEGATLTAPVLAQSGDIYLRQGATMTAPMLNMAKK